MFKLAKQIWTKIFNLKIYSIDFKNNTGIINNIIIIIIIPAVNLSCLAYNDLEHRKAEREKMWQDPGWDDCVAATGKDFCKIHCFVKYTSPAPSFGTQSVLKDICPG